MADDATDTQLTNPSDPQDPQKSGDAKTFTQTELDAMVTARLSKAEKAFEKRLTDELKKAEDRAKLGDADRLKAERDDLAQKLTALEAERNDALTKVQLAGRVTDVDYALYRVKAAGDKYLAKDGSVNVDALVKDHPALRTQPDPKPGPAPTHGGGGNSKGFDMNAAIRHAAGRN